MDEMKLKLSTKFMRGIVAKIISKNISKRFGLEAKIWFKEIDIETVDDKIHFHINTDVEIAQKEILKITRLMNLEEDE